ncbi:MAG: DUF483 domain-containing protein [Candidatus Nealsonbacteria bacterium]
MNQLKNNQNQLNKVEIPSFSRIVWRENCRDNSDLFYRWAEEFNRAELMTVVNKVRDCGIFLVEDIKYQEECFNFNKMGLIFLPIQKIEKDNSLVQPIFSSEKSRFIQCAVSYSEEKAQELVGCLRSGGANSVSKIGKLLGYPSCCIKSLLKYSKEKDAIDSIFTAAKKTKGVKISKEKVADGKGFPKKVSAETLSVNILPEINVALRNFGVKTISHIPCSFDCKESQKISKKFLQFMPSSSSLLKFLAEPMIWDEYKGMAIINTKWLRGATQSIFHDDKIHHIINLNKRKV